MTTVVNVTANVSAQVALWGNTGRSGMILFNDSTGPALIKIGSDVSSTSYSFRLRPGEFWSSMTKDDTPKDAVSVIWPLASTGYLCATEF